MSGPPPNREQNLARPRSRKGKEIRPVTKGTLRDVQSIEPDPDWHPIARMIWDSLWTSGQADFYQNSDLAFAYSLCEDLSVYKSQTKRSSMFAGVIYSAMTTLLMTEGDRRRVRLELTAPENENAEPASVTAIAAYKERMGAA